MNLARYLVLVRLNFQVRKPGMFFTDLVLLPISFYLGYLLRSDFQFLNENLGSLFTSSILFTLFALFIGLLIGLYSGRFMQSSFEEVLALNTQAFVTSVFGLILVWGEFVSDIPRSIPILASLLYLLLAFGVRALFRIYKGFRIVKNELNRKILIYGAGSLGTHIANLVMSDPKLELIGFIDDDIKKSNFVFRNRKILGNSKSLSKILSENKVDQIILAISSINEDKVMNLKNICLENNVNLMMIPSAAQLISGIGNLQDLISYNEKTLLGRNQVEIDKVSISALLKGKNILITGAGGSIGSEISRQCQNYLPSKLLLLDRDESSLHALELDLYGTGNMSSENILLADIRDKETIFQIFERFKPDIVFHAAALKHLPILEIFPKEAQKTNVVGTNNILEACLVFETGILVNISTDKAADPTSILGKTKHEAELLTLQASKKLNSADSKFISVRFGNVIGSRGSVLHTFKYQIDHDLPVTITDTQVTRYFMTVQEAVSLVLQSAVIGENGETLILDMGDPVSIESIARFLISQSGKDVPIIYTGIRPGEKMHEKLNSSKEKLEIKKHPKIFHTKVTDSK